MVDKHSYGSPAAFRRALTDKLRTAANTSKWSLPQLQRQMAYDRLLERLYLFDEGWIVKGATALLARDLGVRATIDIDVYRDIAAEVAERELRDAPTIRGPRARAVGTRLCGRGEALTASDRGHAGRCARRRHAVPRPAARWDGDRDVGSAIRGLGGLMAPATRGARER
jgi:hypothetical protein